MRSDKKQRMACNTANLRLAMGRLRDAGAILFLKTYSMIPSDSQILKDEQNESPLK